ncbi:MAG TPA: potassium-transporting ATPase subunit F [Thermoplasmata archaeon]
MDVLGLLVANLGLAIFTVVAIGLGGYLAYAMVRPETF